MVEEVSMFQVTIKKMVEVVGIGLHKGQKVTIQLHPAEADRGITFYRTDKGNQAIPLTPHAVCTTDLATTIGTADTNISTIEHLMSAIYAYGIDNLDIYIDSEEVPILDGSSQGFCMIFDEVGLQRLNSPKKMMRITKPIHIKDSKGGKSFAKIAPLDGSVFDFTVAFNHLCINRQHFTFDFSTDDYVKDISKARTFGFLNDLQLLRANNLAKGADLSNAIGLDDYSVLNPEGLRYNNEFVRHKILDAIGDLALLGMPIIGKYTSFSGSHHLNNLLARAILEERAYEVITADVKTHNEQMALA